MKNLLIMLIVFLSYGSIQAQDGQPYIRYKDFNDQTISELQAVTVSLISDSLSHGYGGYTFYDSSIVITVAGGDTNNITNVDNTLWTDAGSRVLTVMAGDSITIQTGGAGLWIVMFNLSFSGVNNEVWKIGVSKNGTLQGSAQRNTSNNNVGNATWFEAISLVAGDYIHPVIVNTTDTDNMTVISGSLFLFKLL